jgi:PleD family two-component response regulator
MMTTNPAAPPLTRPARDARQPSPATQKVLIVNGSSNILDELEHVLETGHYDVVFVESSAHAYSQIKRVQPHLVILCVHIDDPTGFQVLSMLKLDHETRDIPVLTFTSEYNGPDADEDVPEPSETDLFMLKPAMHMN